MRPYNLYIVKWNPAPQEDRTSAYPSQDLGDEAPALRRKEKVIVVLTTNRRAWTRAQRPTPWNRKSCRSRLSCNEDPLVVCSVGYGSSGAVTVRWDESVQVTTRALHLILNFPLNRLPAERPPTKKDNFNQFPKSRTHHRRPGQDGTIDQYNSETRNRIRARNGLIGVQEIADVHEILRTSFLC